MGAMCWLTPNRISFHLIHMMIVIVVELVQAGASAFHVLGEQRHPRECFAARCAGILFDVGMCLEMGAQIRFVGEGTMAVLAAERFVAGVCADVSLQQPRSRERLAAQMAFARFGVRSNVHFQGAHRIVRLRAVFAGKRFLHFARCRRGAMELLVLGEAWIGGV